MISEERYQKSLQPKWRTRYQSRICAYKENFHEKFFVVKLEEYHSQINTLIEQITQDNENHKNQQLIYLLESLPKQQLGFSSLYKRVYAKIVNILREKLQYFAANIFEKQNDYYKKTAQFNQTLIDSCANYDRQWLNACIEPHMLVKISIAQCFFEFNEEYKMQFGLTNKIFKCREIQSLVKIPINYVVVLHRYYTQNKRFILPNNNHQLKSLINIFGLLKLKALATKRHINFELNNFKQLCSRQNHIFLFSFCQIAIFSGQPQAKQISLKDNDQFLKQLDTFTSQPSMIVDLQKILRLKTKFRVTFRCINKMLKAVMNYNTDDNNQIFDYKLWKDWQNNEMKLKHTFRSQKFIASAISKCSQIQSYLTKDYRIFINISARNCFAKTALNIFRQLYQSTSLQIKLENIIQPFLAIKRFQFSFNNIKNIDSQEEQKDLIYTLIIATQNDKVIFHNIERGALTNKRYLAKLKELIDEKMSKLPSAVVLFEGNQLKDPINWCWLKRFIDYICKQYRSRLYIFYRNRHCRLNIAIYCYILEYLRSLSPLISKQSFEIFLETYTTKIINLYNSIQGQ